MEEKSGIVIDIVRYVRSKSDEAPDNVGLWERYHFWLSRYDNVERERNGIAPRKPRKVTPRKTGTQD